MVVSVQTTSYVPGTYARQRPGAAQMAEQYIREWKQKRGPVRPTPGRPILPPTAFVLPYL